MWRRATGTPIDSATRCCESGITLDAELFRIPFQAELARRRHVADQRRRGDDGGAGEIAFAAHAHAILPIAVERRDRALAFVERIRSLAEARPAPRLPNLAADRSEHRRDRLAAEPRVRLLDLATDAARSGKDDKFLRRTPRSVISRRTDDQRGREEIVIAAVRARAD